MRGKIRVAWSLLTIASLLAITMWGPLVAARGLMQPAAAASVEIEGPLHLTLDVSPAVSTPRDTITLTLVLTNRRATAANPRLALHLPTSLTHRGRRFPASTTFNYQENVLNWLPLVPPGESASLTVPFAAAVADLTHPEQAVTVSLHDGEQVQQATATFWTGLPPAATVTSRPETVSVGQPVQLQANLAGTGPFTQSWALGDGRHVAARDPVVVYAAPGTYEVTVQVANPLSVATATGTVTVVSRPAAAFAVDDERPVVDQPVQFSDESAGQPPLSYLWDFGDGSGSNERHPTHRYSAPGTYEVRLLVESEHGQAQSSQVLTVGSNATADLILEEETVTGRPLQGRAYTDGTVTAVRWEMGDGATYEGETVSHNYRQAGDYQVTMTAANDFGETRVVRPVHVEQGTVYLFLPQIAYQSGPSVGTPEDNTEAEGTVITVPATGEEAPAPSAPASAPAAQQPYPAPATGSDVSVENAEAAPAAPTAADPSPAAAPTQPAPPAQPAAQPQPPDPSQPQAQPQPQPSIPAQPAAQPEQFEAIALPPQSPLDPAATPAEMLLWYINEARRLHGLAPVAYNYELSIAAQMHTVDMAGNPEIMHGGSDGSRPAERQRRYGYPGAYAGEAVAWGWESPVPVVEFWVNSPPHRTLILNPAATEVGVGFRAEGTAPNLWYWAAEFGIRREE